MYTPACTARASQKCTPEGRELPTSREHSRRAAGSARRERSRPVRPFVGHREVLEEHALGPDPRASGAPEAKCAVEARPHHHDPDRADERAQDGVRCCVVVCIVLPPNCDSDSRFPVRSQFSGIFFKSGELADLDEALRHRRIGCRTLVGVFPVHFLHQARIPAR